MTINKSQGQTLERVDLYLHDRVFIHGQLYVALSRVTSYNGKKILINKQNTEEYDNCIQHTKNIVYQEIFNDIIVHS